MGGRVRGQKWRGHRSPDSRQKWTERFPSLLWSRPLHLSSTYCANNAAFLLSCANSYSAHPGKASS